LIGTPAERVLAKTPFLNVRLVRASHPDHVANRDGAVIPWTSVLDDRGQPIEFTRMSPTSMSDDNLTWFATLTLPRCRPGIRYGVTIDEMVLAEADPADPSTSARSKTEPIVTSVIEFGPFFSHTVDVGE
jgi:hypothetical protein